MAFRSEASRRYYFARHPEAAEWTAWKRKGHLPDTLCENCGLPVKARQLVDGQKGIWCIVCKRVPRGCSKSEWRIATANRFAVRLG
jgi:hypothetical protein